MQNVSKAFKNSIRNPRAIRNRGYIKVYIGVINQKAQDNVNAEDSRNNFSEFSDLRKPFEGYENYKLYATAEENFSKVDGSMYFLPEEKALMTYNNGLVTENLLGTIYISFGGVTGLDIKGLTIDFGECYPVDFSIESNSGIYSYTGNTKAKWRTEEVFLGVSYFLIRPTKMVNGQGRLRILQFSCGIVNIFSNVNTIDYSLKDYVSPISESIPSQDMSLTVDNQDLYYDPDNDNSALAFMEIGQEIRVSFGYDVDGKNNIEWLKPNTCYLKTWKADDVQAKFTATDRFDLIDKKYDRGTFRKNGISLYDLALDVFGVMELDPREYFIDPYLKKVIVNNPLPVVKCTEALQIIANAGRCILYQDRDARIHLKSSFIPEMSVDAPDKISFSNVDKLLEDGKKPAYAMASQDFSITDGNIYFCPEDEPFLKIGYISTAIADENGLFSENPRITINMETAFSCFGVCIRFRNVAPGKFKISTYKENAIVQELEISQPDLNYITYDQFELFDQMVIEITEGYPFARVSIDNILIGDVTDYEISRDVCNATPERSRQEKIKEISVIRSTYRESSEKKELSHEEVVIELSDPELILNFSNPSYGYEVAVIDNANITCKIVESGSYFVRLRFEGLTESQTVNYSVSGFEYILETSKYTVHHNDNGIEKEWENPLISTVEHAKKVEEWLSEYLLGNVDYKINWWSDPCVDANDLFYLIFRNRDPTLVRTYQNEIKFSGAWSGSIKARKAVVNHGG